MNNLNAGMLKLLTPMVLLNLIVLIGIVYKKSCFL